MYSAPHHADSTFDAIAKALAEFLVEVKTRPLFAHVAKHNIGSLRVLQKCGAIISGEHKFSEDGQEIKEFVLKLR